jgi:hypothetical protein
MGRVAHLRLRALCCTALLFFSGGLTLSNSVHVQLGGFRNGEINGIWLWRLESASTYTRRCRFVLSDSLVLNGVESVRYFQSCNDGTPRGPVMEAEIVRASGDPDTVTLMLVYQRDSRPFSLYRATAYSAVGESPLSSTIIIL